MLKELLFHTPVNPVKFRSVQAPVAEIESAPAETFSEGKLLVTPLTCNALVPTLPAFVALNTGVPVIVNPVPVNMVNIVPFVPVKLMYEVPNAKVLVTVALALNSPVLNTKLFKSSVPADNVVVAVVSTVKLFVSSCNPPLGASIVIGCVNVLPAELMVFVLRFENVITPVTPDTVTPDPLIQDPNIQG